jgi:hypothetical protein
MAGECGSPGKLRLALDEVRLEAGVGGVGALAQRNGERQVGRACRGSAGAGSSAEAAARTEADAEQVEDLDGVRHGGAG